jgi:formate C-acetyltransferase
MPPTQAGWSYQDRLEAIRRTKLAQTAEKQQLIGSMDYDDWALILPPPEARELVQTISGSGIPITDVLIKGIEIKSNHPSGGFFGPRACGANFRAVLEAHPPYVDPMSSLAGGYMVNFSSYRKVGWKPEVQPPAELQEIRQRYLLLGAIGAAQHFCQDLELGLELGWGGLLDRIARYRLVNPDRGEFYDGLEDVALGMQAWIRTNAAEARRLAAAEEDPQRHANLEEMAQINEGLIDAPPKLSARLASGSCGTTWPRACTTVAAPWAGWTWCWRRTTSGTGPAARWTTRRPSSTSPVCSAATPRISSWAGRTRTATT